MSLSCPTKLDEEKSARALCIRKTMANHDVYEVDFIMDKWIRKGKIFYLIKWTGYPFSESSYEPEHHIGPCKLLRQYESLQYFEWKTAKLIKIEGIADMAGPFQLFASFEDVPQSIIIDAREAHDIFPMVQEFCISKEIKLPKEK